MSSFKGKKDKGTKITLKRPEKKKVEKELKEELITLANGKRAKPSECVILSGEFYRLDDPNIAMEHFYNESKFSGSKYFLKKYAFVAYNEIDNNGIPVESSKIYTQNKSKANSFIVVFPTMSRDFKVTSIEVLKDDLYEECLETGYFFHKINCKGQAKKTKTGTYRKVKNIYNYFPTRGVDIDNYKYGIQSPTYTVTEGKRYTFGVELETIRGYIPVRFDNLLNYSAVHDGSLREKDGSGPFGGEYVTGVLTGDMGFKQLKLLCSILSERCLLDKRCGVHVHIGGVNFNKEFVVYMYYLAKKLELEIESILPVSRRDNEYCKRLKDIKFNLYNIDRNNYFSYNEYIDKAHENILRYVSHQSKVDPAYINKMSQHPMGDKCQYNHNTARYAWLNFVPTMFNTRGNQSYTIELRNHQGSLNYIKIRNWILIFMAMVSVVENNKNFIIENENITLSDVIRLAFPKRAEELNRYIDMRKNKYLDHSNKIEEDEYLEENVDKLISLKTI